MNHLWELFNEFSTGLKSNGMGPLMADWRDVEAWCDAMRLDLEPQEKRAIIRLARLRADISAEDARKQTPGGA